MRNNNQGFTVIEVLIGFVIIVGLGMIIVGLNLIFAQNQMLVWQNYVNVEQTNSNVQTLVRELRTARTGDDGAYILEKAGDQEIIFYSDIDFDKKSERVHYWLNGSSLYKGVTKSIGYPAVYQQTGEKVVLLTDFARNGTNPIFYYYNGDWPADTQNNPLVYAVRISATKLIRIYLRLNSQANQTDRDFILESFTQIRMIKKNL